MSTGASRNPHRSPRLAGCNANFRDHTATVFRFSAGLRR